MKNEIAWVYHVKHLYFNETHLSTIRSILHKRFWFTATFIFSNLLYHTYGFLLWLFCLSFAFGLFRLNFAWRLLRLNFTLKIFFYRLAADLTFHRLLCSCISFLDMLLTAVHCSYIQSKGIYVLTFLAFLVFLLLDFLIVFLFAINEDLFIVCSIIVILFLWFLTRIKKIKIQWNFLCMANFFMDFLLFIDRQYCF